MRAAETKGMETATKPSPEPEVKPAEPEVPLLVSKGLLIAAAIGEGLGRGAGALLAMIRSNRELTIALAGLGLCVFTFYVDPSSALSLPLFVIGCLMIVRGVLGPRVSGKLTVEWGSDGTSFSFTSRIAPPDAQKVLAAPSEAPMVAEEIELIEGSAETIEIEVSRLQELLGRACASGDRSS